MSSYQTLEEAAVQPAGCSRHDRAGAAQLARHH